MKEGGPNVTDGRGNMEFWSQLTLEAKVVASYANSGQMSPHLFPES